MIEKDIKNNLYRSFFDKTQILKILFKIKHL